MTQSFDEWMNPHQRECFEAGAQSRQAEIDALSALGEMSEQKIDDLVKRNIELQKTVDKLKNNRMYLEIAIGNARDGADEDFDLFLNYLSNILKGKENEN